MSFWTDHFGFWIFTKDPHFWGLELSLWLNLDDIKYRFLQKPQKERYQIKQQSYLTKRWGFGSFLLLPILDVERLQNEFPEYYFVNSASPNWGLSDYTRFVEDYCSTKTGLYAKIATWNCLMCSFSFSRHNHAESLCNLVKYRIRPKTCQIW